LIVNAFSGGFFGCLGVFGAIVGLIAFLLLLPLAYAIAGNTGPIALIVLVVAAILFTRSRRPEARRQE
jgi:membrane protein implicated in regulation of membrane protease activity